MTVTQEKHVYSVSELTRNIRAILENTFGAIWVEGEVSNFIKHQSGHMYFSVKDRDSVLSCVLFRRINEALKFEIKNGMQIICSGKISVYDKRGQYQLIASKLEPKGAGALQIAFEQLKERLEKEGLFDGARKKPVPYLPRTVGVITSPTGAAVRDILNVSKRRFANIEIVLNPVKVQGEGAKEEIAGALDLFNELGNVDVIILGRGGGSLEDLWPFNEEAVARAIARSKIPVISAVGHEVDWTISDFVADKRAPTPSAAAELVIPQKEELSKKLQAFLNHMQALLFSKAYLMKERLRTLEKRYVLKEPFNIVTQYEQEVDDIAGALVAKGNIAVKLKEETFATLAGKLDSLSPLGVLTRGYSITSKNGAILKNAKDAKISERIRTRLAKGEITSVIEKISV